MSAVTPAGRRGVPRRERPHGPLPVLLVLLTVLTGLVDAFSYLELGHVFVANMTGNVVFLGFALGGAEGFVWWASLTAIAAFAAGALAGGAIRSRHGFHRGRHLLVGALVELALVAATLVLALVAPRPYADGWLAALVVALGAAMGVQNATARALGVPDLTTTVLTLTITGIAADARAVGGSGSRLAVRGLSLASMFAGAFAGALLVSAGFAWVAIAVAGALLVAVVAVSAPTVRAPATQWRAAR